MTRRLNSRQISRIRTEFRHLVENLWNPAVDLYQHQRLSDMTTSIRFAMRHRYATRLHPEDVANLLHAMGWAPDVNDGHKWKPGLRRPHIVKYTWPPLQAWRKPRHIITVDFASVTDPQS